MYGRVTLICIPKHILGVETQSNHLLVLLVGSPAISLKKTWLWEVNVLKGTFVFSHQSQRRILPLGELTAVRSDVCDGVFYYCIFGSSGVSVLGLPVNQAHA